MAVRRPLVLIAGQRRELPSGDTVAGATGSAWSETEIDFGLGTHDKTFVVVDGGVSLSSRIVVMQSGNPATGRGTDDAAWDSITYAAAPGTGQFTIFAKASGWVVGPRKIFYQVT